MPGMRYADPSCSGKGKASLRPESVVAGVTRTCSKLTNSHEVSKSFKMRLKAVSSDSAGEIEVLVDLMEPWGEPKPEETHWSSIDHISAPRSAVLCTASERITLNAHACMGPGATLLDRKKRASRIWNVG